MFDALRFLKDHNLPYFTSGKNVTPGWVNVKCPLCSDKSNHGGFNPPGEYYNCWVCGRHDLRWIVARLLGIRRAAAADVIEPYMGQNTLRRYLNRKKAQAKSLSLPGDTNLSPYHIQYLFKRGFDSERLKTLYGIRGTGPGEKWEKTDFGLRIVIPIAYHGQIVSFQARDITGKQELRYKACPVEKSVVNYKELLYNFDRCANGRVIVVEGIVDVWRMGDGFVSSFGTTMTPSQIKILLNFDEVFFLFDPEKDAQIRARKYARELAAMDRKAEVLNLTCGRDPGDLSESEALSLRKELLK
jgi:DNA primase